LGDRFSIPNSGVVSGPLLQILAAESILQDRALHSSSNTITVFGLLFIALLVNLTSRRLASGIRAFLLITTAAVLESCAILVQAKLPLIVDTSLFHTAIAVYVGAIAVDEIDFRGLLGRIAENRFQRIAMSLGDGLVCMDHNHLITVWNPGAAAIFGYESAEIIGHPFDTICLKHDDRASGSLRDAMRERSRAPGGVMIEFQGRRKNGDSFPIEACFSSWQGAEGVQHGALLRDISIRKREAEKIRYLAEHDPLTGLANRSTLQQGLAAMISTAEQKDIKLALLVIGLGDFQQINDMFGHASGDRVLCAVAKRLSADAGRAAIVARLSGDEFAIAIPCGPTERIAELCARIAPSFNAPLAAGDRSHRLKVSIGAAVYPEGGRNPDELLANSHLAFCRAKATQRANYVIFESAMRQELEARLTLEAELSLAAERNEFELFYQPQVKLVNGHLIGAEALIRWRHPQRGLVPPAEFISVVNTSSISDRIAAWVLETACRQARIWELGGHNLRVGVNLSPSQLRWPGLSAAVAEMLELTGLTPTLLELEVTEDILLLDEERVVETFRKIRDLGVRIVFDDFGTGFASLSYLKKFPLDGLKIDKSFVLELLAGSGDAAIVALVIGLGRQLGLSVIAEGIENRATADLLVRMGCEEGQGYLFGRPMPAEAFESDFLVPTGSAESANEGRAA
jgi:diguanylate cyclase (GGDEF)-like protein/PAS domain S-box-containing protein